MAKPGAVLHVRDLMTPSPVTITVHETLQGAMELMSMKHIRHLPVTNGHGELVGLVTDRDLRRVAPSPVFKSPGIPHDVMDHTPVERVMVRAPTTIDAAADVREAVTIFVDKKYGALPVLDGGKLVGILTPIDVMRAWPGTAR